MEIRRQCEEKSQREMQEIWTLTPLLGREERRSYLAEIYIQSMYPNFDFFYSNEPFEKKTTHVAINWTR